MPETKNKIQEVSLILSYQCNYECKMCLQRPPFRKKFLNRFPANMEFSDWCKVIDQLEPYRDSIQYVYLTGGEPFLVPFFMKLVNYIKEKHYICSVNTNGSVLKKCLNEVLESKIDILIISLDGVAKVHDKIRGHKCYDSTIEVIKELKRKRKWIMPRIFVNCTIQDDNVEYLEEWVDEMMQAGVDQIYFHLQMFISEKMAKSYEEEYYTCFKLKPFAQRGAIATPNVNVLKIKKIIGRIQEKYGNMHILHDLNKIDLYTYFNEPEKQFRTPNMLRCYAASNILEITPNGSVITCHDFPDYIVGNVKEQSIDEIWNGSKINEFRKVVETEKIFSICHHCCMSERYAEYDNGTIKDEGAFKNEK